MNKFIDYVLTHFTFRVSHPEETHDRGFEIRWTFFNLAFLKRGSPVKVFDKVLLKKGDGVVNSYICGMTDGEGDFSYWYGWEKGDSIVFVMIDSDDINVLKISGTRVNQITDAGSEWAIGLKEGDGFRIMRQNGKMPDSMKLSEETVLK